MIKGIAQLYRRAYSGLPREAWFLFAVNLVNASGAMVIFFLSLYLTRRLGFTPARAGKALWFGCAGVAVLLTVAFSALRRSLESS